MKKKVSTKEARALLRLVDNEAQKHSLQLVLANPMLGLYLLYATDQPHNPLRRVFCHELSLEMFQMIKTTADSDGYILEPTSPGIGTFLKLTKPQHQSITHTPE